MKTLILLLTLSSLNFFAQDADAPAAAVSDEKIVQSKEALKTAVNLEGVKKVGFDVIRVCSDESVSKVLEDLNCKGAKEAFRQVRNCMNFKFKDASCTQKSHILLARAGSCVLKEPAQKIISVKSIAETMTTICKRVRAH